MYCGRVYVLAVKTQTGYKKTDNNYNCQSIVVLKNESKRNIHKYAKEMAGAES